MADERSAQDVVDEGAMTVDEAVKWSSLGRTRLYKAMDEGRLPFIKLGKRRLIPRKALRDLLARAVVEGSK